MLFPNEAVVLLLARMIAMLGPIDTEMLQGGQETHKYFTKEYDLYYIDEVCGFYFVQKSARLYIGLVMLA